MEEKIAKALERVVEGGGSYDNNLFDEGVLNSLRIVDLIIELEEIFSIEIDSKYITEDNFATKLAIAGYAV
jgi:acyl carrier protein